MAESETIIKVFSPRRLFTAFSIGVGIDFASRLIQPTVGPLSVIVLPFFAAYYTAIVFIIVLVAGIFLNDKRLKNYWFKDAKPFKTALFIGIICFLFGTITAYFTYFTLQKSGNEADVYIDFFARPGFAIILFALAYKPTKPQIKRQRV